MKKKGYRSMESGKTTRATRTGTTKLRWPKKESAAFGMRSIKGIVTSPRC
jgi:hypothetical protein